IARFLNTSTIPLFSISRYFCTTLGKPLERGHTLKPARFSPNASPPGCSYHPSSASRLSCWSTITSPSPKSRNRNLDDPATVAELAKIVKHQKNLDALMLLTLADGQGTSAEAWSDWKESLVWELFHETSRYLTDQKSYYEQTKIERESLQVSVAEALSPDYADEIEAHFDFMPDNYFRGCDVPEIVEHLKLLRSFFENVSSRDEQPLAPAIKWKAFTEHGHSLVSVWTWDHEQLLAKIAGSLS